MNYKEAEEYCKSVTIPVIASRFEELYPYIFTVPKTRDEEELRIIPYKWYMIVINNLDPYFLGMILSDEKPLLNFDFIVEFTERLKTCDNFLEVIIKVVIPRH